jgi:type II secretory pathway pseudopilin PulG
MVAVSIAAGVISLLVPALLRQVAIGEEANRLTAVEAVVSKDLDWFANYAKIWKLKSGSYPDVGKSDLTKAVTKTATEYISGGAAIYEPNSNDCSTGLAAPFLADAKGLDSEPIVSTIPYLPPYAINA